MNRVSRILCIAPPLIALSVLVLVAQEVPKTPVASKPLVVEPIKPKPSAKSSGLRRDFSLRRSRHLGFTPSGIRAAHDELKVSGEIDDESTGAEKTVAIAWHIKASHAEAFNGIKDLDWDAIFNFIEKVLKLLGLI